jgi:hypothetical protein
MKTNILTTGILGMMLVFGLIFTACPTEADDDDDDTNGNETTKEPAETFTDVAGAFPLAEGQTGLTLVSAQKSDKTGIITIKLGGSIGQPTDFEDNFSPGGAGKPEGSYAYVSFSLVSLLEPINDKVIAIRQENDALRYYANSDPEAGNLLAEPPEKPVFGGEEPNIYVPASPDMPVKWKANAAGTFDEDTAANSMFIVSDAASPRIITIGITTWSANEDNATKTGDVATIILDYSALEITAEGGNGD